MTITGISLGRGTNFRFDETPLVIAMQRRAQDDRPAFTYLDYSTSSDGVATTVTWRELVHSVNVTAGNIAEIAEPGSRIAILAPQDLSYVIGFLAALRSGTIAVPLFAPDVSSHSSRLVGAIADCAADIWLTAPRTEASVRSLLDTQPVPRPKHVLCVAPEAVAADNEPAGSLPAVDSITSDQVAYLQYTSGSTRNPAGAVITHRALSANVDQSASAYSVDETFTCAGWIPFFHDMGLIQLLCLPVRTGARSVFSTPMSFVRKPVRWLRQLSEYPNVLTAAPNFAFEYATKKVTDDELASMDLSGLRIAINGSEPVRASTIAAFESRFAPAGFTSSAHRPSYGLAEATVFVSTGQTDVAPTVTAFNRASLRDGTAHVESDVDQASHLVAAGTPVGQWVLIVDAKEGTPCEDGTVGEIWINGPNVADSYWQAPDRTDETFRGRLTGAAPDVPAQRWLRTGDLGLYHDGQLYITGRLKDLIIIDGKNYYPQDIESTTYEAHAAIRRDHVAAFGVDNGSGESVVVVAEYAKGSATGVTDREITMAVRKAISAQHDLRLTDLVLVQPGGVQRTSSGKIARRANKERYLAARIPAVVEET